MIFKILFYYIIGYLNIEVEGVFVERFINICKSKNILLWNVKMKEGIKLYANIGIKDYKNIKEIVKKTNTKAKIRKKCGIPFVLNRYRKRKIFIAILFLFILSLIVVSNFVWNINITGNENVKTEEIKQELANQGLKIGAYKQNISTNDIINKIRLNRDDIAWIGITIKGTNAIVEIKESTKAPEIVNENEYCNIISDKEGIITKINVQNGTAKVKEGDIVKKGDILAYGYLEGKYTGIRYVHALAKVEAKVWYSKKEKVFLKQQIPTDTGNTETKYSLNFNNFRINFYKTLSKFENYDTISESRKLMLFSNFYLPIELIKTTNKEYVLKDITYTEEEITKITVSEMEEELKTEIQDEKNIVNEQVNTNKGDGYIEIEVIYEVLETIGVEDKIIF